MRHSIAAALLVLPLLAGTAWAQNSAGDLATTSLLKVCMPYLAGEPAAALVARAQSGGFVRDSDRGGVLGERLTWTKGSHQVGITLTRAEGRKGPTCRIDVSRGAVDGERLEREIRDWALGTRPAFIVADRPRDFTEDMFGPKPASRTVFERPAERLIVERFSPPADGAIDLLDAYAIVIKAERR